MPLLVGNKTLAGASEKFYLRLEIGGKRWIGQIAPRDAGAKPEENGFDEQAIVRRPCRPHGLHGPAECL